MHLCDCDVIFEEFWKPILQLLTDLPDVHVVRPGARRAAVTASLPAPSAGVRNRRGALALIRPILPAQDCLEMRNIGMPTRLDGLPSAVDLFDGEVVQRQVRRPPHGCLGPRLPAQFPRAPVWKVCLEVPSKDG